MRVVVLALVMALSPLPALADARITVLMDVLRISEVIGILRDEGLANARSLDAQMLEGRGGAFLEAQVRQIYDVDAISERFRQALEAGLAPDQVEAAIAFFGSPEGARIITLENEARRALADPRIETAARELFATQLAADDPAAERVVRFIAANDLLERNVAGSMSANLRFYTGLADGGYTAQSREEIIAEVWAEQDAIRAQSEAWLGGFLYLAYHDLPEAVMDGYIGFSEAAPGQALNAALFDGYEAVYRDVSYALGRAIALSSEGDEI
jgi:hypothetical protein